LDRKIILSFIIVCFPIILYSQTIAPVKVIKVEYGQISEIVEGHGIIKPFPKDDIKISAVSPMRIDEILVKPGDEVKKGQLVIKLQRDHSIDLSVEKAKITLQQAEINLKRAEKLFKSGVIAKVKLENAQTEYNLAKADYNLQLQSQKYAIENSDIRSPINGIVSSVNGVIGQVADPTQELIHIVNMSNTIASIGIETEDMAKVQVGQPAVVTLPNLSDGNTFDGKVIKQNREINPATQLIHIWIEIKNPKFTLQPGMFAEAKIFVKTEKHALVLPKSAVLKDPTGNYVYVVKNKTAHKIYIKTGITTSDKIQVVDGLKEGDVVVYIGNYELEDGMQVLIQK